MSSTGNELARRTIGNELALPTGARQLGSRVKPIIRLGMGIQDPQRGFPIKTDYLTVRGDDRAIAKFHSVYGDQPKAVKIMVPSSLELALDISYRSFVGGQGEGGGRPLALGFTNFAPLGYVGGPDMLRVWKQDGTYVEVETQGLDETGKPLDQVADELNIEIHTTFTFTIPEVLGWGSFAQITSKGKKSADNLTFKLTEIYSAFGAKAPWAFNREEPPMLVLKPDTALTKFTDKDSGESKWGKSKIYVLDIVIPEAFHDMQDRLVEHQRTLAPNGPAAALYSTYEDRSALPPSAETPPVVNQPSTTGPTTTEHAGEIPQTDDVAKGSQTPSAAASSVPGEVVDDEPDIGGSAVITAEDAPSDADIELAGKQAAMFKVPNGKYRDVPLGELMRQDGGEGWLRNRLSVVTDPPEYVSALWNFARVFAPELYQEALAKKEAEVAS